MHGIRQDTALLQKIPLGPAYLEYLFWFVLVTLLSLVAFCLLSNKFSLERSGREPLQ